MSCPKCNGESGYYIKYVASCKTLFTWECEAIDTQIEKKTGGIRKRCIDCGKIIKEGISYE